MKRITIIVCGFSLAIALAALPFQYMEHITSGLGLSLAAVLLAWIGILQRKSSQETYKHDVRLYSASTLMKVVDVEESEFESWENQPDGSSRLRREKIYLPTYEYAVNGKKYWYYSRKSVSGKGDVGKQVVGYYDPNRPDIITENRPGKPVFGGGLCFFGAAVCLIFSILVFTGIMVSC